MVNENTETEKIVQEDGSVKEVVKEEPETEKVV